MNTTDIDMSGMQEAMSVIGLGIGLFLIFVLAAILLLNRRNMNGWDLPVSYVWFAVSGRINRKTYWLTGVVGVFLVEALYELAVNGTLMAAGAMVPIGEAVVSIATLATAIPFMVFMVWTSIAVSFKRIHDRNRSAWFLLIGLIPVIGLIWLLVELGFLRGTPGENRFGSEQPDVSTPRQGQQETASRSATATTPDANETPSLNLGDLPNRDMITARLGDDFFGPLDSGQEEHPQEDPGETDP